MSFAPRVSVIVRSYNRVGMLCELLARILGQRCDDAFEVVIVEQSTRVGADEAARLAEFAADPRVRILKRRPLGGPRARNVGALAARGEILLFMDDDDLPADDGWIAAHLRAFADPNCLGATGRWRLADDGPPRRWSAERASRWVLSYVPLLKYQQCYNYVWVDRPVRVATIHGGNVSLRRSAIDRFGLWDECTPIEDELSFNYRLAARKRPDEHLLYLPDALMIRGMNIPGGMDKRFLPIVRHGERLHTFLHNILGHYFPVRFALLYPAYVGLLYGVCVGALWGQARPGASPVKMLALSIGLLLALPGLWVWWTARMIRRRVIEGPPRHDPGVGDVEPTAA